MLDAADHGGFLAGQCVLQRLRNCDGSGGKVESGSLSLRKLPRQRRLGMRRVGSRQIHCSPRQRQQLFRDLGVEHLCFGDAGGQQVFLGSAE